MRMSNALVGIFVLNLAACGGVSLPEFDPAPVCQASKIAFSQATGCVNDDSFEFCIPADDPQALAQVQQIVPDVECMAGRGRAQCDSQTQLLCLVATRDRCQVDQPDALTDAEWDSVCQLAAQPFIQEIVPTWYE